MRKVQFGRIFDLCWSRQAGLTALYPAQGQTRLGCNAKEGRGFVAPHPASHTSMSCGAIGLFPRGFIGRSLSRPCNLGQAVLHHYDCPTPSCLLVCPQMPLLTYVLPLYTPFYPFASTNLPRHSVNLILLSQHNPCVGLACSRVASNMTYASQGTPSAGSHPPVAHQ